MQAPIGEAELVVWRANSSEGVLHGAGDMGPARYSKLQMCIRMRARLHARMHPRTHACAHTHTHTCTRARAHTYEVVKTESATSSCPLSPASVRLLRASMRFMHTACICARMHGNTHAWARANMSDVCVYARKCTNRCMPGHLIQAPHLFAVRGACAHANIRSVHLLTNASHTHRSQVCAHVRVQTCFSRHVRNQHSL